MNEALASNVSAAADEGGQGFAPCVCAIERELRVSAAYGVKRARAISGGATAVGAIGAEDRCQGEVQGPFGTGMSLPLPSVNDEEGGRLPGSLPPVIDAHVHLFAEPLFQAIWRWFEMHGWPIRYKLLADGVLSFLFDKGIEHVVALHYAHKPGIAREMNAFIAALVRRSHGRVTGLATVFPGEPNAREILEEAFDFGLSGVKLHCHVQCFAPDADVLGEIYDACQAHSLPLVMHAGREPKSTAYKCDPHLICSAERVRAVLDGYPDLKLCVPHLGADEFDAYERLLGRYENLWLDTTMMMADYFPIQLPRRLLDCRPDRILYGTDFPNLPYAWDREIVRIARAFPSEERLGNLLSGNARNLFGIPSGG